MGLTDEYREFWRYRVWLALTPGQEMTATMLQRQTKRDGCSVASSYVKQLADSLVEDGHFLVRRAHNTDGEYFFWYSRVPGRVPGQDLAPVRCHPSNNSAKNVVPCLCCGRPTGGRSGKDSTCSGTCSESPKVKRLLAVAHALSDARKKKRTPDPLTGRQVAIAEIVGPAGMRRLGLTTNAL